MRPSLTQSQATGKIRIECARDTVLFQRPRYFSITQSSQIHNNIRIKITTKNTERAQKNILIPNAFISKCQFYFFSVFHVCACFLSVIITFPLCRQFSLSLSGSLPLYLFLFYFCLVLYFLVVFLSSINRKTKCGCEIANTAKITQFHVNRFGWTCLVHCSQLITFFFLAPSFIQFSEWIINK